MGGESGGSRGAKLPGLGHGVQGGSGGLEPPGLQVHSSPMGSCAKCQ